MKELNMEKIAYAVREVVKHTDDHPFIFAVCRDDNQIHMLSNLNPEGVTQMLKACMPHANDITKENKQ